MGLFVCSILLHSTWLFFPYQPLW